MLDHAWKVGDKVRSLHETVLIAVGTICEVVGYEDDECIVLFTDRKGSVRELSYPDSWFEEWRDVD